MQRLLFLQALPHLGFAHSLDESNEAVLYVNR